MSDLSAHGPGGLAGSDAPTASPTEASGPPRPVVLVAHGSPDPRSPEAVRAIARTAGARAGFLEFNEPDPVEVLTDLADNGFGEAVALPLLLTDAYHSRTDLPEVARRAREARPGLQVALGRPVGDPALADALIRGLPEDIDGLVVLAAGTRVDSGRDHVRQIAAEAARRLALRRSGRAPLTVHGEAGFASGPGLTPAAAVADLRSRGARTIAAVCYFIAPGLLCDKAIASAREAGVVHVGEPIGTAPELIDLIARRAAAAAYEGPAGKRAAEPTG
ncbi:sirohydrochlorin chelatase [Glycomyces sp. NRRL B-16210]|uniref:sirohydrochlorin chelatase n=1 Tax=Glycomyces sp. NRRL B-16210 TaxID=1463821 RepID=UPI000690F540|nr:CbiX/SirB N-terminal domain-containing protein [Glycomyces sp. NRRL B-16210]